MNIYWNDGTSLYHYGIKGQHWGERRYQNEDGSYTEEGKRRYGRVGINKQTKFDKYIEKKTARVNAPKTEKEIKTATIAAMTGFGVIGAFTIAMLVHDKKQQKLIEAGRKAFNNFARPDLAEYWYKDK